MHFTHRYTLSAGILHSASYLVPYRFCIMLLPFYQQPLAGDHMVPWTACVILIFDSLLTLKLTAWQYFSAFTAKSFTFWDLFMIFVSVMFTCRLFTVTLEFGLLFVHRIPISKELIRHHVRFWFQSSMSWQHVLRTDISLPPFINCVHFLSIVAYSYLATLQKVSSSAHWWCLLFVIFLTDTQRIECCIIIIILMCTECTKNASLLWIVSISYFWNRSILKTWLLLLLQPI